MEQMRPELAMFAQYMEHKLKLNDHKGGWEKCTIEDLFNKLRREVDELEVAIKEEPSLNVAFEAADIANFAMMITWNVMRELFNSVTPQTARFIKFADSPTLVGTDSGVYPLGRPSRHQVCDACRSDGTCADPKCVNYIPF